MKINQTKKTYRCKTTYNEKVVDDAVADFVFNSLRSDVKWVQGVPSKKGPTRLARPLQIGDNDLVDQLMNQAIKELGQYNYRLDGIYLNYYQDGKMWTPNHSHPGTHQIVISLGCERVLNVAKKEFKMKNGSAIIFGSATHGVPKCDVTEGRISIASFLTPIGNK